MYVMPSQAVLRVLYSYLLRLTYYRSTYYGYTHYPYAYHARRCCACSTRTYYGYTHYRSTYYYGYILTVYVIPCQAVLRVLYSYLLAKPRRELTKQVGP